VGGVQDGLSSLGYQVATDGADIIPITCPKARGVPIAAPKVRREPMRRPEDDGEELGSRPEAERINGRSPREKIIVIRGSRLTLKFKIRKFVENQFTSAIRKRAQSVI